MSDHCASKELISLEVALKSLQDNVTPITETELVPLEESLDRILAELIVSPINAPPHNNSAMDGYGIRFSDLADTEIFPLAGQALAGHPFKGDIPQGHCIRIMTGASIPEGVDTVIMQEHTEVTPAGVQIVKYPERLGQNIRQAGEDIHEGALVFTIGRKICPQDIGLIASLGISGVLVFRRLKAAVFSTGDELKLPGEELSEGNIYDSNRLVVKAILKRLGAEIIDLGRIADDKDLLRQTFLQANEKADIVISSGGVSVGDADYTKDILDELGQTHFWKLAIKPGKPFAFGQLPNSVFFGLPGNPVSATVTFDQLVAPTINHMMNRHADEAIILQLPTVTTLKKHAGRRDFQRGKVVIGQDGTLQVLSSGNQGSGVLSSMSQANCYIVLMEEQTSVAAGELVTVQLFGETLS